MYVEKTERKYTETLTVVNVSGRFMAYFCLFVFSRIFL